MEGAFRRYAVRLAALVAAALLLAGLLSFHPNDPTLTNLRYPKDGVANWIGYPGALVGGSLAEFFGLAALLLPALLANAALARPSASRSAYAFHAASLTFLAAAALGLGGAPLALGLKGPGLIGWSAGAWLARTAGQWMGAALLAFGLGYALWQVLRGAAWVALLRRCALLAAAAWAHAGAWVRSIVRAMRRPGWSTPRLRKPPPRPLHGAAFAAGWLWERAIHRPLTRVASRLYTVVEPKRDSLVRHGGRSTEVGAPAAFTPATPAQRFARADDPSEPFLRWLGMTPPEAAPPAATPSPGGGDPSEPFLRWMGVSPDAPPPTPAGDPSDPFLRWLGITPAAAPPPPSVPPLDAPLNAPREERVARWEEHLQRYKEQQSREQDPLILSDKSFRKQRLEELAREAEDDPA